MLFDVRTYTCRVNMLQPQLRLYEEMGLPVQKEHLGEPYFFGVTETGDLHTYTHIWKYESAADRETKRGKMLADPRWQTYLKASGEAGYLIAQKNTLMNGAPFFTPKE